MISVSSSLASSTPATSLKVTFFCWLDIRRARLFPNESALLPPDCIWRMRKIQKPIRRMKGSQDDRKMYMNEELVDFSRVTTTPFCCSSLARSKPASDGMTVLNFLPLTSSPSRSSPMILTDLSFSFVMSL